MWVGSGEGCVGGLGVRCVLSVLVCLFTCRCGRWGGVCGWGLGVGASAQMGGVCEWVVCTVRIYVYG